MKFWFFRHYPEDDMAERILVGTAKGLIEYCLENDRVLSTPKIHFTGFSVNLIYVDEHTKRWWAGLSHRHWGQKLHFSDDQGQTWQETRVPGFGGVTLPDGRLAKLRQIWCMAAGGKDRPGHLWLGTDPGGLFFSDNNGASFQLVESLWNHPSRQKEEQWFGAGSDFPFIHSIEVDPRDSDHLYIAVSCAGVFETQDAGKTWHPRNNGLVAAYLPNPNAEVGHDPHRMLMVRNHPDYIWQQNHCGIFYTKEGGENWIDVSGKTGFPYYGFALMIEHDDPSRAWVIPVESDESRIAPDLKLSVLATTDFGATWKDESEGLPNMAAFDIVLRHSACNKNQTFVLGTNNGNLYIKDQIKKRWELVSSTLTKVNSVCIY